MKQEKKKPEADRNIAEEPYVAWKLSDTETRIRDGLSSDILSTLQDRLRLSRRALSGLLMISPRTLDRRMKENRLPPDESERSYRIARLTDMACETFGTMDAVADWFKTPNYALGDRKPIDLVKTEPGARLVERTLGQIQHGITV